ncbi:Flavin-containing monooxygenase ustF2 [Aspergillus pseudonomiae]
MANPQTTRVAVVGAGISGVLAAGHLLATGLEVTVFERNAAPGGVWYAIPFSVPLSTRGADAWARLYDEQTPIEPSYPAMKPSKADPSATNGQETSKFMLEHAPPGPCYYNLQNNVPTPLLEVSLKPWPDGTPDTVRHDVIQRFIQDMSIEAKVHDVTRYGARVKKVVKDGAEWKITWSTPQVGMQSETSEFEQVSRFDVVVVASGHYHAPRVPDIPGLSDTKRKYGSRILHSKQYRRPESFRNKNILMIGGGVSSIDIANDISPFANTIYQSTRNSKFDLVESMLPKNGVRVHEISHFEIQNHSDDALSEHEPLPLTIHFESGECLHGIHLIMLCTGYHITFPYLEDYHSDETTLQDADENILITDGTQVHNLYQDIFYIPDPTLVFVGLPYYTFTFSIFDFQAIVVAQVLSGTVQLPTKTEMRSEYNAKVERVGLGKVFHSILGTEENYVHDLLTWVNTSRAAQELVAIKGFSSSWYEAKEALRQKYRAQVNK